MFLVRILASIRISLVKQAAPLSRLVMKTPEQRLRSHARAASLAKTQPPGASIARRGGSLIRHRQPHAFSAVLVEHRTSRVRPTAFRVCRVVTKTNAASPLVKPVGEIQSTLSPNRRAASRAQRTNTPLAQQGKRSVQNAPQANKCLLERWAHVFVSLAVPER